MSIRETLLATSDSPSQAVEGREKQIIGFGDKEIP
jgi:hypothetical protein